MLNPVSNMMAHSITVYVLILCVFILNAATATAAVAAAFSVRMDALLAHTVAFIQSNYFPFFHEYFMLTVL